MNAAHDTHNETVGLGAVHEGHQNAPALFYTSTLLSWLTKEGESIGDEEFSGIQGKIFVNLIKALPRLRRERCLWLPQQLQFSSSARWKGGQDYSRSIRV